MSVQLYPLCFRVSGWSVMYYWVLSELSVFKLPPSLLLSGQIPVGVLSPEGVRRGIWGKQGSIWGMGKWRDIWDSLEGLWLIGRFWSGGWKLTSGLLSSAVLRSWWDLQCVTQHHGNDRGSKSAWWITGEGCVIAVVSDLRAQCISFGFQPLNANLAAFYAML